MKRRDIKDFKKKREMPGDKTKNKAGKNISFHKEKSGASKIERGQRTYCENQEKAKNQKENVKSQ